MSGPKKIIKDDYLGDGVYASYDGYGITLDLRAQDHYTRIVLEPEVMRALRRYEERCLNALKNHLQETVK